MSTGPISTYDDWTSSNVDLLIIDELAERLGVPLEILVFDVQDPSFPRPRRCGDGLYRWRAPDCVEWSEGQRKHVTKKRMPGDGRATNLSLVFNV